MGNVQRRKKKCLRVYLVHMILTGVGANDHQNFNNIKAADTTFLNAKKKRKKKVCPFEPGVTRSPIIS